MPDIPFVVDDVVRTPDEQIQPPRSPGHSFNRTWSRAAQRFPGGRRRTPVPVVPFVVDDVVRASDEQIQPPRAPAWSPVLVN